MGQEFLQAIVYTLIISFLIQTVFFAFAASFKTDKVTDLSYGLTFIIIASYLFFKNLTLSFIQLAVYWAVIIWGVRLVAYLYNRILKIKKDRRFDGIRENFLKFARFWLFQGIAVWIIMIPSILVLSSQEAKPFGFLAWAGLAIWLIGLLTETIADYQKFVFKNQPKNKNKWIQTGLWRYSRHPNYFGEMLVWWGIFSLALPYLAGWKLLSMVGPLFITFILLFVSGIPPLEKRSDQKYGKNKKYREYKKKTSLLIPLPPR